MLLPFSPPRRVVTVIDCLITTILCYDNNLIFKTKKLKAFSAYKNGLRVKLEMPL